MRFKVAATEHLTIQGDTNHMGIHNNVPAYPLDIDGNTLIEGSLCVSNDRAGFISMNDSAALQVTGSTNQRSMINITRFGDNSANFPSLVLTKNHNSSASGNTATPDNSVLGAIEFQGARGSADDFGIGARILARTAAAFASNERSTNLEFLVATGNNLNTYMVLTNYGALHLGDNSVLDTDYSDVNDARLVLVDGSGPEMVLHRRDTQTSSGEELGAIKCSDSDGTLPADPSAKIEFVASQAHSATAKGTDIVLGMCENGTTTITNRFTFRDSGAFGLTGDTVGNSGDVLVTKGNAPPEYAPVGAKAYVVFVGTTGATGGNRAIYNVSSVDDNGDGDFTVNFTNSFPNANYAIVAMMGRGNADNVPHTVIQNGADSKANDKCNIQCYKLSNDTLSDAAHISVLVFDS